MKQTARFTLLVSLTLVAAPAAAQQVHDNVNVLPVYKSVRFVGGQWVWADDGLDYVRGNLYGQRLNEPAILVSSKNKDHIMIFFNDYRAVDVQEDQPIPGTIASPFASLWNGIKGFLARLAGRPAHLGQPGEQDHAAWTQAGLGCSVSYDGGLTWAGCFVPGLPFDDTAASLASPSTARNLQGMSDPAVAQADNGLGYLANIAFTYDQGSQLQVHTVQDMNDSDVHHTWTWKNIVPVSDCNNASWGCFVDKPAITAWGQNVYVTFTTFTGTTGTGSNKFQSKVNLALSTDGARTFSTQLVDGNFTQVQGTDVEVSRASATDPAGTVFVFFRSFNSPDTIVLRRSTGRSSGWDKPVDILAAGEANRTTGTKRPTLQKFDQPTIGLANPGGPDGMAFRSNAFPAAAMTPDGRLLIVTFQEEANASGDPDPAGTPRIMMTYSTDGGRTWSPRKALSHESNRAETRGLGFFSPGSTTPGPQVQPAAVCSTNSTCLVTWMESKEALSSNGWMSGFYRRMNHRAMVLQIQGGVPAASPSSSFQVSRYSYDDETIRATDADGEVERNVNGSLMWSYWNFNNYSTGTSPFDGDYTDVRALTENTFITAFTDNRYVLPPAGSTPWNDFKNYGPWPSCTNPGSRAQTVMAAQISAGLTVTAPTNFKSFSGAPVACGATFTPPATFSNPTQQCIEFPLTAWNNTGSDKRFKIWLEGNASFAKDQGVAPSYPLKEGGLNIYGYSSNSANVYAFDGNAVTVKIAECPSTGCTAWTPNRVDASITFNASTSAPPSGSLGGGYAYTPSLVTVSGRNVSGRNVSGRNVSGRNVSGRNSVPGDPVAVIDYSVQVTATSDDDAGAYLSLFNVDEAYAQDYFFQVLVTKPLTSFTTVNCEPFNLADGALVGQTGAQNVSGRNVSGRNVSGRNVSGRNPVPIDGDVSAQTIQNTSFTMGSSTQSYLPAGNGTGSQTNFGCPSGWGRIGECTLAAPRLPNTVTVTLRAYQLKSSPARVYDPSVAPPAITVAEYSCKTDDCFAESGPDLKVPTPPSASVSPTTVIAGGTVTFPFGASVGITNSGKDCGDGDPCGTARAHKFGIYLSTASEAKDLPRYKAGDTCADPSRCVPGMVKENLTDTSSPITTRVFHSVELPALTVGQAETVSPTSVTIPASIPRLNSNQTGTYYAYLYVDDERVVSELNEDNNIVKGGPITVLPPEYKTTALMSPCSPSGGADCVRSGNGAVPLAWQFTDGTAPIDSLSTPPTLRFYQSTSTWGKGAPVGVANPSNVSTGSSSFQYCDAALTYPLCSVRPAFTWQYNWNRTCPSGADVLPGQTCTPGTSLSGYFLMYVEVVATGQTEAKGKALGPFKILLQ